MGLALVAVALLAAACRPAGSPTPLSTPGAGAASTQQPGASATQPPAPTAALPAADLPVGVDADGNFYKGNPNAAVKLVEFSDFQ
jgi:protein-disulfide isomerase